LRACCSWRCRASPACGDSESPGISLPSDASLPEGELPEVTAPDITAPAPEAAATPAAPDWKTDARSAYAEARWLYDEMDGPLATWRGDSLYQAGKPGAARPDPARQGTWDRLPARMSAARDALYRVESAAPSSSTAQLATVLVAELSATRAGVDQLAEARRARRAAEDDPAQDADAARSAELVASDGLADGRRRLSNAIVQFSSAL
jgi:hypothetical protein